MARKVFYSFRYSIDSQRVAKIKNIGAIEGQPVIDGNKWEEVEKKGQVQAWIDKEMKGRSCVVVLIGRATAGRKWVKYEIEKGWNDGKGVVGVYIHNVAKLDGTTDTKGKNPFEAFTVGTAKKNMSKIVKAYDPPGTTSAAVYNHIAKNLDAWVEEAIKIRRAN